MDDRNGFQPNVAMVVPKFLTKHNQLKKHCVIFALIHCGHCTINSFSLWPAYVLFQYTATTKKTWLENHGNGEYKRCCLHIETQKTKKPKPLTWINLLRISDWFGAIRDFRHPTHSVFKKQFLWCRHSMHISNHETLALARERVRLKKLYLCLGNRLKKRKIKEPKTKIAN